MTLLRVPPRDRLDELRAVLVDIGSNPGLAPLLLHGVEPRRHRLVVRLGTTSWVFDVTTS